MRIARVLCGFVRARLIIDYRFTKRMLDIKNKTFHYSILFFIAVMR